MPGQGRKRADEAVAPVVEGELVPSRLEELDEPAGREGEDELDDAVEMNEGADEDEDDEDEDEEDDEDDEDEDEDEDDEDDEDLEDDDPEADAER